jgi:hypothetical protein
MATAQSSKSAKSPRASSSSSASASARSKRESDTEELSSERDEHYNLISVLYHGLQGADQCALYAEDADDAGDDELAEFLRDWGRQQGDMAKQAKQLLLQRVGNSGAAPRAGSRARKASEDDDEIDEDDDEE